MTLSVDIRKQLGDFHLEVQFQAEEFPLALLGASACGKSVTLKCIAGILTPDAGHIELDGEVLFDSAARVNLPPQRRRVGYLFQNYALFPHMTVRQNLAAGVRDRSRRQAAVADLLRRFQLEGTADQKPGQLSGGQQQRCALARILAAEPRAILLDEPFSALDTYLKHQLELEVADTLADFSGPVVWVSHDQGEVFRNCRRVCVLDRGRSQPMTTPEELFRAPATEAAARLSGCENFLDILPQGDEVFVPAWRITLSCDRPVPPDTRRIGLRAGGVLLTEAHAAHALPCTLVRMVEDISAAWILLRPQAAPPDAPLLRVEADKALWQTTPPGSPIWVSIPPESILPLRQA